MELFNKKIAKQNAGKACSAKDVALGDPFVYKHLGSMASVGRYKALVDLSQSKVISLFVILLLNWATWVLGIEWNGFRLKWEGLGWVDPQTLFVHIFVNI